MKREAKRSVGVGLAVSGFFFIMMAALFPHAIAHGMATIVIDTSAPEIGAINPCGNKTHPTHFDPDTTVTLKMSSFREKAKNPRVEVAGETHDMSYSGSESTHYGTSYYYTTSWSTTEHSGKLKFTFKGEDDAGNVGSDSAWAVIGSYADGYFTINGKKVSKGATMTLATRKANLTAVVTEGTPDEVWYIVKAKSVAGYDRGQILKSKSDTVKTSTPYRWTYTFPKDGTYTVNGYFRSYGKSVQVMSVGTGVNSSPVPIPIPSETWIFAIIGAIQIGVGIPLAARPEVF